VIALAVATQGVVLLVGVPEALRGFAAAALYAAGAWMSGLLHPDDVTALARTLGGAGRR
jgi:hypothetical protein